MINVTSRLRLWRIVEVLSLFIPYIPIVQTLYTCANNYILGHLLDIEGDDSAITVLIPFEFPFYCQKQTRLSLSTNGLITFEAQSTSYSNTGIPSSNPPNGYIAPFWDDLMFNQRGIYTYTNSSDSFHIQWTNVGFYGSDLPLGSFSTTLMTNGTIQMDYLSLMGSSLSYGGSATIGLENYDGSNGIQISYMEAILFQGLRIQFDPQSLPVCSYDVSMSTPNKHDVYQITDAQAPQIVSYISPKNNAFLTPTLPSDLVFEWTSSLNTDFYKMYLSSDVSFQEIDCFHTSQQSSVVCNIQRYDTYHWKVYSCNSLSCIE